MAEQGVEIRAQRMPRKRGWTGPWMPGVVLAVTALVCAWLAVLPGCDAMKSEQNTHEYVDDMVIELCAPGEFYRECWWTFECHRELAVWVVNALPTFDERIQTSPTLRQHVLERVFFFHIAFVGPLMAPEFQKEACLDETRWKHLPPGEEGSMARLRATMGSPRPCRRRGSRGADR